MNIEEIIYSNLEYNEINTLKNIFKSLEENKINLNFETYTKLIQNNEIDKICTDLLKKPITKYLNNLKIYQLLNIYCDYKGIEVEYENNEFDEDIFSNYLKYIKNNKLNVLTEAEEKELLNRYRNGDKKAKEIFIKHNLRLVIRIANQYYKKDVGIDIMELIEEGNMGLIRAFETYDESLGFKFSTYSSYWISQRMSRYIKNNSRNIRLPVNYINKINNLKKSVSELTSILQKNPSLKEISEYTNYTIDEIHDLLKNNEQIISLNDSVSEDDSDTSYIEFIKDESNTASENIINNNIDRMYLNEILNTLTPHQQNVLRIRYGLDDGIFKTLEETGRLLNVSRESVRQIESRSLKKLYKLAKRR